ncbi:MAG: dihydrofolate reductase [Planctomycetota bacterium]
MRISAVVASTPEGIIGDDMAMPWRLSSDLRRFKALTMGGTLLMGRRTFDSIGRVLPGRQTIVLTRSASWTSEGVDVARSSSEVLSLCHRDHLFVVGGGQIYDQWWDRCDAIWWTRVWANLAGDTRVQLPRDQFRVCATAHVPAGPRDDFPTDWMRLERRSETLKLAKN